jgi:hypothetical protein
MVMVGEKEPSLPAGFEDLEKFVADWALPRELQRMNKRCASSIEAIRAFYDAMIARVEAALDHLDKFDLGSLPEPERRLFYLTLSLVEVGNAVEFYKRPNSRYAFPPDRMLPTEQV